MPILDLLPYASRYRTKGHDTQSNPLFLTDTQSNPLFLTDTQSNLITDTQSNVYTTLQI
jgi:hypothetical protein